MRDRKGQSKNEQEGRDEKLNRCISFNCEYFNAH